MCGLQPHLLPCIPYVSELQRACLSLSSIFREAEGKNHATAWISLALPSADDAQLAIIRWLWRPLLAKVLHSDVLLVCPPKVT